MVVYFRMSRNSQDVRKFAAHRALHLVDGGVREVDGKLRIDAAMIIDDKSLRRLARANVMDVGDASARLGVTRQRVGDRAARLRLGVLAGQQLRLGGLYMRVDLDRLAELLADRLLEIGGDRMRAPMRHAAVELEIERDGEALADQLRDDVMHLYAAARGDEQNALERGLVVDGDRMRGERDLRAGESRA